jgi:nucleoside-diphosphate-sugar epimerase
VVIGPPVQPPPSPHLLNETLKPIWDVFSGAPIPPAIGSATYVDIRDVADVHVWALEHPREATGQRYLVTNGRGPPQAAADLLRKVYPERRGIIQEGKPGEGYVTGTYGWPEGGTSFEAKKAKAAIASEYPGRNFIGFEQSVLETAKVFERYV